MSKPVPAGLATAVLQALPQPVIVCGDDRHIVFVNYAAEAFFGASLSVLSRQRLDDLIAFGSPILGLFEAVMDRHAPMTEYRVRVGSSRFGDAGDDRVGLVRAFLVAGAARVLASLWPVDDALTEVFMQRLYAALAAGQHPAAALRSAQLASIQPGAQPGAQVGEQPHPCHWAAFTLHGGW